MPYPALPDHRIAYDIDGTVVGYRVYQTQDPSPVNALGQGFVDYATGAQLIEQNDEDLVNAGIWAARANQAGHNTAWFFFPERREVTAIAFVMSTTSFASANSLLQGSTDSTNGSDGAWETASLPNGWPTTSSVVNAIDGWRSDIKAVSFTGGKRVIRMALKVSDLERTPTLHLYGEKVAGQTPNDIVFIDAPDFTTEFATALDFGDRPLGTTVVDTFKVKNVSGSLTANSINLQCNDADFVISDSASGPWVTTINITSLAAGASSVQYYVKNTTPNPGAILGPRFARIVAIVGSWS
jgi:hypothetical protein